MNLSSVTKIYIGDQEVSKVYQQNTEVFSRLWSPSDMTSIFWYDAADTSTITLSAGTTNSVAQWDDKSGNGWTLAPTTAGKIGPDTGTRTLNGLNVLEWTKTTAATNQILENDTFTQAQPFCAAIVLRLDDEALSGDQDFFFSGTETSNPRIATRRTINNQFQIFTNSQSIVTPIGAATEDQNYLLSFFFNSTNTSTIRINGSLSASGPITNNSFTSLNIGGNFLESESLDGYIAEVVAFADNTKQEIVEGYLAWKWGLEANLPGGHLYKNSPPRL